MVMICKFHFCPRYVLGILMQAMELEEEKRLREQCQSLLAVAKNLFSHLGKDNFSKSTFKAILLIEVNHVALKDFKDFIHLIS